MLLEGLPAIIFSTAIALAVLMAAAERGVKSILSLLEFYGYSETFGGLVIFSLSTSLPEIFSHLVASFGILSGQLDYGVASATVLGANIGSDVIQQTFILGMVVLFMGGLRFERDFLKTAYLPMIGTTLMCIILGWDGIYSRLDGAILFGTFIAYMLYLYGREKRPVNHPAKKREVNVRKEALVSLACLALVVLSAHFLLLAIEDLVRLTGLGGSLIGVISLGVASASPELFTAIAGLRQKSEGVSLGTLIGSNIVNPLVAIGGGAMLSTYLVPKPLIYWDLPMETITAALLLAYLIWRRGYLGRIGGIYLIALYFFYLAIRIAYFAVD